MNNPRGQNIVEYILLVVAVILVMILFLKPEGRYHKTIQHSLDGTIKELKHLGDKLIIQR